MRKPPYQRWRPSHRDHWLPNVLPGFETPSQVEARRLSRVRILRNGGTNSRALADKLANCSAKTCCDLPTCPICMRRVRAWFAGEMLRCFAGRHDLLSVNIVPADGEVPDAELAQFDLLRFVNTQRQRLGRLNLPNFHAIAAVDMTFDVRDASWLFHLHLVTAGIDKQRLMRELKRFYLVTPQIHRPVVIKPVRDPVWQLSYRLKAIWNRKEHYISAKGRPKEYPLKGPELRRLLLFLDRGSPTNLTFLFRAEFGANGNLRLKSLSLDQRGTQ